jgi:hypothetical protein
MIAAIRELTSLGENVYGANLENRNGPHRGFPKVAEMPPNKSMRKSIGAGVPRGLQNRWEARRRLR